MGRFSQAAFVAITSLLISGCSLLFGGDEPDSSLPVAESPPQPSPLPLATPKPESNAILIKPTNPEQRLRELKSGRVDPFRALVSAPATSATSSGSTAVKVYNRSSDRTVNQSGQTLKPATPLAARSLPRRVAIGPASRSGGSNLRLPTLPQPDIARGVQVTGIISMAGIPKAIVKAPGEAVSRSVAAGERLANGQVLVKRIDVNGSEPVVILEQYGTEVAVGVGKTSS